MGVKKSIKTVTTKDVIDKEDDRMAKSKFYVYFYYNDQNEVVYVGKANDVGQRWRGHQESWKKEVTRIGVRVYGSRVDMDIAERYYIAKLCPKYNKAGTAYGKTSLAFKDKTELEILTVKSFKERFVLKDGGQSSKGVTTRMQKHKLTLTEQLKQAGVLILEAESVNLFEDNILNIGLDNVCFKYKNIYLVSRYTPFKPYYKGKNDEDPGFRTNRHFKILKDFLCDDKVRAMDINDGNMAYYMRSCTKETAEVIFSCGSMFSLYVTNDADRERLWANHSDFRSFTLREGSCILECKAENEESFYRFNRNEFTLDLKKIYNQYEHLLSA